MTAHSTICSTFHSAPFPWLVAEFCTPVWNVRTPCSSPTLPRWLPEPDPANSACTWQRIDDFSVSCQSMSHRLIDSFVVFKCTESIHQTKKRHGRTNKISQFLSRPVFHMVRVRGDVLHFSTGVLRMKVGWLGSHINSHCNNLVWSAFWYSTW